MGRIHIRPQAHDIRSIMLGTAKCKPTNLPLLGDLQISVTFKELNNMGDNCSYTYSFNSSVKNPRNTLSIFSLLCLTIFPIFHIVYLLPTGDGYPSVRFIILYTLKVVHVLNFSILLR